VRPLRAQHLGQHRVGTGDAVGVCTGSTTSSSTEAAINPHGPIALANRPLNRRSLYAGSHQIKGLLRARQGRPLPKRRR
jgi:hypothetical protein